MTSSFVKHVVSHRYVSDYVLYSLYPKTQFNQVFNLNSNSLEQFLSEMIATKVRKFDS